MMNDGYAVSDDSKSAFYGHCTKNTSYCMSYLLLRIIFVSSFLSLAVIGLISYFWMIPAGFMQGDLTLFLSCFFIVQMIWHYFSLFEWQSEGLMRNRQSVWMFFNPNRLLITSLTILLAVILFYWNYLFLPKKVEFLFAVFLIVFLPQFFVRIWDVLVKKDTSRLAGVIAFSLVLLVMAEEVRYGIGFRYMTAQVEKVAQLESMPGKPKSWDIPIPNSPRWKRDGLAYYPQLFEVLNDAGFEVDRDTHLVLTPQAKKLMNMGIMPFNHYQGTAFSGLKIVDRKNKQVYQYEHPNQFKDFEHIDPFILKALLVWENDKLRHLVFDEEQKGAELNYLIEGPRIVKSVSEYVQYKITGEGSYSGGSTLMTTLEKITNTPGGRTHSINDKLNQMIGAGLHLYASNEGGLKSGVKGDVEQSNRGQVKKALVDFLNTVPMAGGPKAHAGELFGFGAAYYAWFGYTIDELNQQLKSKDRQLRAQAYKNICSLIVSIRRPSELLYAPEKVAQQANLLLSRLDKKRLMNSALYIKSRAMTPKWNYQYKRAIRLDYALHREMSSARNQYTQWVRRAVAKHSGKDESKKINLQTVDAMPVAIEMTTDAQLEKKIRTVLDDMHTELAQKSPFVQGHQRGLLYGLSLDELKLIEYGVVVLEIDAQGQWKILANTDTQSKIVYNPAKQGRFQWGSTAKLRVLVNYLMIIHDEALFLQSALKESKLYSRSIFKQYRKSSVTIKRLLASYIKKHPQASMEQIMSWAMSRRISASPAQKFLTGESWHEFHNYKKSDDKKNPSLWQMTTQSINLSFVRLMRDVVDYYIAQSGYDKVAILKNKKNPVRKKIIADAVHKEEVYYQKGLDYFIRLVKNSLESNTLSNKLIIAQAKKVAKTFNLQKKTTSTVERKQQIKYQRLKPWFKRLTANEKSWLLARIKPSVGTRSKKTRVQERRIIQQSSRWLKSNKSWIKNTLYTYMEREAFANGVTPAWQKLGYPFKVSPSYAVVLGSSGDTPMSLLELAGTLLNKGVHEKNVSAIKRIILAPESEFETPFKIAYQSEAVIPPSVAKVAKKAMEGVLRKGTAIFASRHPLMKSVQSAGAKTGTGDNRFNKKAINRSAAVLSILDTGEGKAKYAICITMSVTKGDIERYTFTSKVPVRILTRIADHLSPVVANKTTQELALALAKNSKKKYKKKSAKRNKNSQQRHLNQLSSLVRQSSTPMKRHKNRVPLSHVIDDSEVFSDQLLKNLF